MALIKILPEFVARPWGQRSLAPLFEIPPGATDPIGEIWLTSMECRVEAARSGDGGMTLGDFWAQLSPEERGSALAEVERFPLLLKFIFTGEKLSVQVHPGDEHAQEYEGEPWGKTEAWYILAAEPDAWVKVGFQAGTGLPQIETVWGKAEIEGVLNHIKVKAGDTIFVPSGTVHAIGPGLCLCEVQQYSDVTYRVCDYGRAGLDGKPRQLHLEQARAVTRIETPEAGRVTGSSDRNGAPLVSSSYFSLERFEFSGRKEWPADPAQFTLLVVCEGKGVAADDSSKFNYQQGETYLLTAGVSSAEFDAAEDTVILRVSPSGREEAPE